MRVRERAREQHGERAAARADVRGAKDGVRVHARNPRQNLVGNDFDEIRARHDYALVDVKTKSAQLRLARDVGGGNALDGAAEERAADFLDFRRGQPRVEKRFDAFFRQLQHAAQQENGFVERAAHALPEKKPALRKQRHGKARPVAQRRQRVRSREDVFARLFLRFAFFLHEREKISRRSRAGKRKSPVPADFSRRGFRAVLRAFPDARNSRQRRRRSARRAARP